MAPGMSSFSATITSSTAPCVAAPPPHPRARHSLPQGARLQCKAAVAASFGDLHSAFEGMRQSNNVDKIGKPVSVTNLNFCCCCCRAVIKLRWCITTRFYFMNHMKLN
jgi:hypothetical protein